MSDIPGLHRRRRHPEHFMMPKIEFRDQLRKTESGKIRWRVVGALEATE